MKTIAIIAGIALGSCASPYSGYGVDVHSPDAQAWIAGIVAVEKINESFDRQMNP